MKPVDGPDELDCVLKPEKPLPNGALPLVDGAVEVAGDAELNPKALLPKVLALDVDAREAPNGEPVDIVGAPPNGVELEVVVVAPKLPPNGDDDVVVVPPPNPPPNVPVLGADVVGLSALAKPPPNGLDDEVAGPPNILDVGADVVVVEAVPNPPPNGLGIGDEGEVNALVLGAEVVAVVEVAAAPNPPANGVEVGAAEVVGLPKTDPAVVVEPVAPPNGRLEEVVGVKLNPIPPKVGLEPKPVDIIGLVVGEVD